MICPNYLIRNTRTAMLAMVTAAALAFAAMPAVAQGADKAAPLTGEAAALKRVLEQKFPGAEVRGISKTPYFGLY